MSCSQVRHGQAHARQWFAVRVKSNRERVTADQLAGKALEVFLPMFKTYRKCRSGRNVLSTPLFAGYVFCRFDPRERLPVLTVPGVVHIVGFGNSPEPIEAEEIERVVTLTTSRLQVTPFPHPPVGKRIQIQHGPLRGVEGIVLAHDGEDKLVVSVSLLQRSIAVAVERDWIDGHTAA